MPSASVHREKDGATYTTSNGAPCTEPYEAQRVGQNGPLLLQDFHHIDLLAHFDRERIPERVVHAKGAGAHGYLEITHDLSDICSADIFKKVGNKAKATVRFSTVGGESGSADTARDPRGFSVKLKTEEGNWDWVFNNTPVFFVRDPAKFPHFIHTQKRDPQTHLKDNDMFWDYLSQNPESVHQVLILFGDRGIPDGYRFQHGYSGHTFKFINEKGELHYVQIHLRSDQGIKTLTQEKATKLAGENPDYSIQDLFEAIEKKEYPTWSCYVQTMTPAQAEKFRYNILDLTKIWSHKEFPLRPFGKLVLNENPNNYFAEIEQSAFAPSHLVPGVEPSADPVLQSRLFSYPDTHRHRLGVNYQQLPVNAPSKPPANFQRDGLMAFNNQGSRPNYVSTIQPLSYSKPQNHNSKHEVFLGEAQRVLSKITELDFEQPNALWNKVFDEGAKERFVNAIVGHLGAVTKPEIIDRQLSIFAAVDATLGKRLAEGLKRPAPVALKANPASEAVSFEFCKI
ncbi:catalase [Phakopsora pachyrhizi]|uniref:Catalase n=1 Tax=Phakopsora pachyrhizi TaxID=170000 RepID=A0A0S1MJC5_PHAPC|nr:catalase [Phakopsora pachyrhizi]